MTDRRDPRPPLASLVFGYGAMLPLVLAALGGWAMAPGWAAAVGQLAAIWAALILAFIGGVRRGYGFAVPAAGTAVEVVAGLAYFAFAGLALIALPNLRWALAPLVVGFALVALLDRRAALRDAAPAHFARLRPPQMLLGAAALAALWLRTMI